MDEPTRLDCLKVMGIESWILKDTVMPEKTTPSKPASIKPETWGQLKEAVSVCTQCALHKTRTQPLFGDGNLNADWLLVGETPTEEDDLDGKVFTGAAGFLLTEMLRAIHLTQEDVFITYLLKCPTFKNKTIKVQDIRDCDDYLQRQQALLKPKIILAIGRVAAQKLLNTREPLSKLRGKVHYHNAIPLVVVYHPAYLLRALSKKPAAWLDLQLALKTYQHLPPE